MHGQTEDGKKFIEEFERLCTQGKAKEAMEALMRYIKANPSIMKDAAIQAIERKNGNKKEAEGTSISILPIA